MVLGVEVVMSEIILLDVIGSVVSKFSIVKLTGSQEEDVTFWPARGCLLLKSSLYVGGLSLLEKSSDVSRPGDELTTLKSWASFIRKSHHVKHLKFNLMIEKLDLGYLMRLDSTYDASGIYLA